MQTTSHHRRSHWLLFGIIALAVLLRAYGLTREGLWLDEARTIDFSNGGFAILCSDWTQGPLFLILIRIVRDLAGTSELTLRFLPMIFGTLCVPAIYHLGKRAVDKNTALIAALFMAVNPFAIHYSQDARPYTLFLLGSLVALNYSLKLAHEFRWPDVLGFAISVAAALYTHPFGVFLLPVLLIGFLSYWKENLSANRSRCLRGFLIAAAASALLFIPQVIRLSALFLRKTTTGTVARWITVPNIHDLLGAIVNYFMMPRLAYAVIVIILLGLLLGYSHRRKPGASFVLIGSLAFCCLILPWLVSVAITPIFVVRYTIPALSAFILSLAWALSSFRNKVRVPIIGLLLLITVWPLYGYYTEVDKDPWRETAQILQEKIRAGDVIVGNIWYLRFPLGFYFHPADSIRLVTPPRENDPVLTPDDENVIRNAMKNAPHIFFVKAYGSEHENLNRKMESLVQEQFAACDIVNMDTRIIRNRWAYHVARITITRYEPATAEALHP
jgi:uncharacterized membrane protein